MNKLAIISNFFGPIKDKFIMYQNEQKTVDEKIRLASQLPGTVHTLFNIPNQVFSLFLPL